MTVCLHQFKLDFHLSLSVLLFLLSPDSTHNEHFSQRMTNLIELIYGVPNKSTLLPGDVPAFSPTVPIDVKLMDSLTVHAKMR